MGCCVSKAKGMRADMYAISGGDDQEEMEEPKEGTTINKDCQPSAQALTASCGHVSNLPRPKLDPKDYQFVNCKDEVKLKLPGDVKGQSFTIDNCENCDIYLLDYCSQVTIDDCKKCRIFVGPTDGAVFIRNCISCNLAVICRQLRTRDCKNCKIALHCRTKPIVESSSRMGFSCLDLGYPQLYEHMRHARLSPFHNFWWHIYDFTPENGNWQLLPPETTTRGLLEPVPQQAEELLAASDPASQAALLKTHGETKALSEEHTYLFIAFAGGRSEQAMELARMVAAKGWLLRTNEVRLNAALAGTLVGEAAWAKATAKELTAAGTGPGGGCVGLELVVPVAEAEPLALQVKQMGGHTSLSETAGKMFRTLGIDG